MPRYLSEHQVRQRSCFPPDIKLGDLVTRVDHLSRLANPGAAPLEYVVTADPVFLRNKYYIAVESRSDVTIRTILFAGRFQKISKVSPETTLRIGVPKNKLP